MDDRHLTTLLERAYPAGPLPSRERLEQRATAIRRGRRTWRAVCAIMTTLAVAIALFATLPDDRSSRIEAPAEHAPSAIPNVPTTRALAITPNRRLRNHQLVRVSGHGFSTMPTQDGLGVTVMTCRTGATPATAATDCDQTTKQWPPDTNGDAQSTGTVGTVDLERFPYWLSRTIILAGQPIDCAVTPGCVLLAKDGGGDVYGVAPLDFDPRAPSLPPVITVSTREDLHNGQMITIRGRNFTPSLTYGGQAFYVGVCVIDTQTCDSLGFEPGTPIRIGLKGTFSITYRVWSAFESRGSSGWDLQDCLSTTCAVAVGVLGTNGGAERIPGVPDIPLSFAPGTRALNPRITTDPLSPYQPGQQVTVTLHDFPFPMRGAEFMYPRGPNLALCDAATLCAEGTLPLTRDPSDDGRYTATFVAQPSITLPNGQPADCTQPGDCVIALHSGFALTSGGGLYPANRMDLLTVDFLVVG